jgi:methionine synthase II (cobalamin-independent)
MKGTSMSFRFNCIATGIGSLPVSDPDKAAALSLRYLPEAPFWPQLPQRDFREHMDGQYSESLPGLEVDAVKNRFYFDSSRELTPELEKFFERYLEKDYEFFKISEEYAAAFPAFVQALKTGPPPGLQFVKGHITGPLTAGISFKDETGRDIVHNDVLFDAVVKGLSMKAAWQIQVLKQFGKPVIIFIDEPAMESLGSAFSAVAPEFVAEKLNEIIDVIHELGGIAGIHCCGNADWPMIFKTKVDIVNFDAFGYMDRVLLYPGDIKAFLNRGGSLAWGIVPTGAFTGAETADLLISRLNAGIKRLEQAGMNRETILNQCLLTPSCGMGSLTPEKAVAILKLLREVSDRMQNSLSGSI